jgi:hypothetical protein
VYHRNVTRVKYLKRDTTAHKFINDVGCRFTVFLFKETANKTIRTRIRVNNVYREKQMLICNSIRHKNSYSLRGIRGCTSTRQPKFVYL